MFVPIPQKIKDLATKVRTAVYGKDVREAIAESMEETGLKSFEAREITEQLIDGSFDEGLLNTNIQEKLANLEVEYTPRLSSAESQLAQKAKRLNNISVDIVVDYGADPTGATDNKMQIDEALSFLASKGGGVLFIPQNATILTTGSHFLTSNIKIKGAKNSIIKLVSNTYARVLETNPSIQHSNIELENLIIDGDYTGADDPSVQKSFHAIFLRRIRNLKLKNITIKNPVAWCSNIADCNNVSVDGFQAFSVGDQMDGLHFVDCNNVRVNDVYCETGDDCVGVTVDNASKITNHFFTNIYGKSVIGSLVRLNQSDRSYNLGEVKTIETMYFLNLRGENCGNRGFSMASIHPSSTVTDIRVDGSFKETSREGVRIHKGKRVTLNIDVIKCGTGATLSDGSTYDSVWLDWIDEGTIDVKISDVTDGKRGLRLTQGTRNKIRANVDYVVGSKTNRKAGVMLERLTYSTLNAEVINTPIGVLLGNPDTPSVGALRNFVRNCFIRDASTYAVQEVGTSNHNEIQDNHFVSSGGVSKNGANTRVSRNNGHETERSGTTTMTNGLSTVTVNHGLFASPNVVTAMGRNAETSQLWITDITATTFRINVPNPVSGDRIISWRAEII